MAELAVKSKDRCRWDLVALGEVMLRLDPGEGRVATTRSFQAWEGGGEYNVARGLRRCFGLDTAVVTAFAGERGHERITAIQEGGYSLDHMPYCVLATVEALAGLEPALDRDPIELDVPLTIQPAEIEAIQRARKY